MWSNSGVDGDVRSWVRAYPDMVATPHYRHPLVRDACGMQRTGRQASLIKQVQAVKSRLDESRLREAQAMPDHPGRRGDRDPAADGRRVVAGGLDDGAIEAAPDARGATAPLGPSRADDAQEVR